MMSPASPPLTYFPAYLGLFAALVLATTSNAFLDIQYGSFGMEVLLWSILFGTTLIIGWRQQGQPNNTGKRAQRWTLALGLFLSLIVFIPMWGFPRAGLAILAMLQAAQNCVTVSRRLLHFGLLVSTIMVMFAATHYRADWTMLFYLVPYITAVVFTLVAEQINHRAQDLRQQSLSHTMANGQGAAITAATTAILLIGALLYALTPQPNWGDLNWRYGQPSTIGTLGPPQDETNPNGNKGSGAGGAASPTDNNGQGHGLHPDNGWPSPAEMRQAAQRPGMPDWQRNMINNMADANAWVSKTLQPVMQSLKQLWQSFKNWLSQNRGTIARSLIILAILALLVALWRLMREAKTGIWLLTRFDYLRFGLLGQHSHGPNGARELYEAMGRLFALHEPERSSLTTTQEYQRQLRKDHGHLAHQTAEMTLLFEDARYGQKAVELRSLKRMQALYKLIYQQLKD